MIRRTKGAGGEGEREEVKAILPRPRTRSEDTVDVMVAMADSESSLAHSKMAILATICHGKRSGRERRARRNSPR